DEERRDLPVVAPVVAARGGRTPELTRVLGVVGGTGRDRIDQSHVERPHGSPCYDGRPRLPVAACPSGSVPLGGLFRGPGPGTLPRDLGGAFGVLPRRVGTVPVGPEGLRPLLDLTGPVVVPPLGHAESLRRAV